MGYVSEEPQAQAQAERAALLPMPAPVVNPAAAPQADSREQFRHLQSVPVPGLAMDGPEFPPKAGEVLLGYEVVDPKCGFRHMSLGGMLSTVILAFVCWPLAFVPCCLSEAHERFQRPVYGPPPSGGAHFMAPPPPQYYSGYPQQYVMATEPPVAAGFPASKA